VILAGPHHGGDEAVLDGEPLEVVVGDQPVLGVVDAGVAVDRIGVDLEGEAVRGVFIAVERLGEPLRKAAHRGLLGDAGNRLALGGAVDDDGAIGEDGFPGDDAAMQPGRLFQPEVVYRHDITVSSAVAEDRLVTDRLHTGPVWAWKPAASTSPGDCGVRRRI
jgi:hypothetical protein